LNFFKYALRQSSDTTSVPSYFLSGERNMQVLHARLRNKCSNLNEDLFLNHLQESPLCTCSDTIEDAEHYFFRCNLFCDQRHVLFQMTRAYHPLNTRLLLFGSINLSDLDNALIFDSVHKYIKTTKRFKSN
jgi:hypothetical protein